MKSSLAETSISQAVGRVYFKSSIQTEIGPIEMSVSGTMFNEAVDIQADISSAILGATNDRFPVRISFLDSEKALLSISILGLNQSVEIYKR